MTLTLCRPLRNVDDTRGPLFKEIMRILTRETLSKDDRDAVLESLYHEFKDVFEEIASWE